MSHTATRSVEVAPLAGELPALPITGGVEYRCPKLLLYFRAPTSGEESPGVPVVPSSDRLSPRLEGPARLDGPVGGEGRDGGGTGEPGRRLAPAPIGDGRPGARDDVGELCTGREGREGPPTSGECCLRDVEGE